MGVSTLGQMAVWSAIAAAAAAIFGGRRKPDARTPRWLLAASAVLAALACTVLVVALLGTDVSLSYVARTTSRATPWPYRLAALWGGNEGSLLFYAALTLTFGAVGVSGRAASVVAAIGGGELLLGALAASPFVTPALPPVDGQGLLAILQHPAMVYHPPILYSGLTALAVPFALAATTRTLDRERLDRVRRWLIAAWTLLTLGMAAGANWAYVELGWGGFWAWDPVENTSLMPWLAITAFLHVSRVSERDGRLSRMTHALALVPFGLSVGGMYLTRSGVTGSVHAFADGELVGAVLGVTSLLAAVTVVALTVRAGRGIPWGAMRAGGRDTWLAAAAWLSAAALAAIAVGSLWPAWSSVVLDRRLAVEPRYFAVVALPPAILMLVGSAFGLERRWSGACSGAPVGVFLGVATAAAAGAAALTGSTAAPSLALLACAAGALVLSTRSLLRARWTAGRSHLAHVGIALVLLGVAGSGLGAEARGAVAPGESVALGPYTLTVASVTSGEADRYVFVRAEVDVSREGTVVERLAPEIRGYESQPLPIPEPALRSTPASDMVVAISRVTADAGLVQLQATWKPMVFWVWAGSVLLVGAGLRDVLAAAAGARRRRSATPAQPEAAAATAS